MIDAPPAADPAPDVRGVLVRAASRLLGEHGPAAVTTRAVAQAAGVQAPAIYRLFGDKDGMLEAVAEYVMDTYVSQKAADSAAESDRDGDPVDDLRAGWDAHVAFGLANPTLFELLHVAQHGIGSPAALRGAAVLRDRVHRVAAAGRLRVGEQLAAQMIHAAGTGAVLAILAMPAGQRTTEVADSLFGALAAAILADAPSAPPRPPTRDSTAATVTFRTVVPDLPALTDAEKALLTQWLDRAIAERPQPHRSTGHDDPPGREAVRA